MNEIQIRHTIKVNQNNEMDFNKIYESDMETEEVL